MIDGRPPSLLQDGSGRFIDGPHNGTSGSNAVAILSRGGASVEAVTSGTIARGGNVEIIAIVDALFVQDVLAGFAKANRPRREHPVSPD